ncbi:WhiB family transcriptional regulator [Promicromonospora sp. NPDC050880]|uniref:WhiB family transcriptional regulator n=1 Tax=Promicromonospora sp. NPDC050880 TaxID=3364406 RepID=UPI0037A9C8BA
MIPATSWMLGALCARPVLRDLPWTVEDTSPADRARMARVCAACPVLAACEVSTITTETTAGFWAGRDLTVWPESSARVAVQDTLPGLELTDQAAA